MRAAQVLVVEDSELDYALIEMILQECANPPSLQRAEDGEEAIKLLEKIAPATKARRPDLVLLDFNMPRVNGLEVLEFIKSQEFIRDIPVVMFSSSRNVRDMKIALDLGADEFLTKPLSLDLMKTLLNGICSKYLPKQPGASA